MRPTWHNTSLFYFCLGIGRIDSNCSRIFIINILFFSDATILGDASPQTDADYELTESINIKEEIDNNIVIEEHNVDIEVKTEDVDDNPYQNIQVEVKHENHEQENSINFRKYIETRILEEFKVQSEVDSILPITPSEEADANVKQECLTDDALISFDFPTFNDVGSIDSGSMGAGSIDSNDATALGNVEACLQEDGVSIKYENDVYDVSTSLALFFLCLYERNIGIYLIEQ